MALSDAATSRTTAPISVPIVEHRAHILRSNSAPRSSKTSASRPRTKPSAARASQGVPRCGRRSNGTFVIDWNSLCYGLSYKLDRSTPPSAAQVKTRVNSNSGQRSKCSQLEPLSHDGCHRSQNLQTVAGRLAGPSPSDLRRLASDAPPNFAQISRGDEGGAHIAPGVLGGDVQSSHVACTRGGDNL